MEAGGIPDWVFQPSHIPHWKNKKTENKNQFVSPNAGVVLKSSSGGFPYRAWEGSLPWNSCSSGILVILHHQGALGPIYAMRARSHLLFFFNDNGSLGSQEKELGSLDNFLFSLYPIQRSGTPALNPKCGQHRGSVTFSVHVPVPESSCPMR